MHIYVCIYIYIYVYVSRTQITAVTWQTAQEGIVADLFYCKKNTLVLLVHKQQASQACLSSCHSTACSYICNSGT